jgi:hypothetical protein
MNDGIDVQKIIVSPKEKEGKINPKEVRIRIADTLGDSVTIEIPEGYTSEKPWEITYEDYLEMIKIAKKISKYRGIIISKSILIEVYLDDLLTIALFGNKITESSKLFERFILASTFFTFENKRRTLHRLLKNHPLFKNNDYSAEFKSINKVITIRNSFAHGKIIFRGNRAFLEHINEHGEIIEDELTNDYLVEKSKNVRDANLISSTLHVQINDVIEKKENI